MSSQSSLFDTPAKEVIDLPDAKLIYWPSWLQSHTPPELGNGLYDHLQQAVAWEQSDIILYGKTMKIPRLNAWYGDPGCGYIYSGRYFEPLAWLDVLLQVKFHIEEALAEYIYEPFNSALVNRYRDGQDSVAWHSDDEPELGHNPLVASLSLGQERVFQLKHKYKKPALKYQIPLKHGDLLLMAGTTQSHWQHQIPKSSQAMDERLNITFRKICHT